MFVVKRVWGEEKKREELREVVPIYVYVCALVRDTRKKESK